MGSREQRKSRCVSMGFGSVSGEIFDNRIVLVIISKERKIAEESVSKKVFSSFELKRLSLRGEGAGN